MQLKHQVPRKTAPFRSWAFTTAAITSLVALAACSSDGTNSDEAGSNNATTELVVAHALPPEAPSEKALQWFTDEVTERTGGSLTFEITASETLCEHEEIANCVDDGRVDVGVAITDYTPQLFPGVSIMGVPFLTENPQAAMSALYTTNQEHSGAQDIWEANNLKMIGHWSAGRIVFGSATPVENLGDIKDQRWRVSGPYLQEAIKSAGGHNIAITANETYEGIQRGVADAVGFSLDGPVNFKLTELLPEWTDPGIGHYNAFGMWMNQGVFNDLDEDQQEIIDEVITDFNEGEAMLSFNEVAATQCDALLDSPEVDRIDAWSNEATSEWRELVGDDLLEQWVADASDYGLDDAQGFADLYVEAMEDYDGDIADPVAECASR